MRTIPAAVQTGLERETYSGALLAFLMIEHVNLADPIRLVCDPVDYVWDGETWIGIVFDWKILTDTESQPETELSVPNVDRRIGQALERLGGRAQITLTILTSEDFDTSVDPRVAVGTPSPVYQFAELELANVTCDAMQLTGTISRRDYTQYPAFGISATKSRLPGLFA